MSPCKPCFVIRRWIRSVLSRSCRVGAGTCGGGALAPVRRPTAVVAGRPASMVEPSQLRVLVFTVLPRSTSTLLLTSSGSSLDMHVPF